MEKLFKKIAATVVTAAMVSTSLVIPAMAEETAPTDADKTWRVISYEGQNVVGSGLGTQKFIANEGGIGTKSSSDKSMKLQQTSADILNADGTYNTGNFKLYSIYSYNGQTSAEYLADKDKKYGVIGCDFYLDDDSINRFRVEREGGRTAAEYYSLNKVSKQVWHSMYAIIDFSDIENKNFGYTYYLDGEEVASGVYGNQYNTEFPTQLRLVFDDSSVSQAKCAAGCSLAMHMDNVEYYVTDGDPTIAIDTYENNFDNGVIGDIYHEGFLDKHEYSSGVGGKDAKDKSLKLIYNANDANNKIYLRKKYPQAAYAKFEFSFLPGDDFTSMNFQTGYTQNIAGTEITNSMLKDGWNKITYVMHDFDGKRDATTAAAYQKKTAFYTYVNGNLVSTTYGLQTLMGGKPENPYDSRARFNFTTDGAECYIDDFSFTQTALPPVIEHEVEPEPTAEPEPVSISDGSFENVAVGTVFGTTETLGKFSVGSASNVVTDEAAADGQHSLKITPNLDNTSSRFPGVNYLLALHKGVTYKATAKVKLGNALEGAAYTGGSTYIRFVDLDSYSGDAYAARGEITFKDLSEQEDFVTLETIFTMPDEFPKARLNVCGVNGYEWYVDDFTCEETAAPTPTPEPTATPVPSVEPVNVDVNFNDESTGAIAMEKTIGAVSYEAGVAGKDADDKSGKVNKLKQQTDTYFDYQAVPSAAKYLSIEMNFMPNSDDFDSFRIGTRYSSTMVQNITTDALNPFRWNNMKFYIENKDTSVSTLGANCKVHVKAYINGKFYGEYDANAILSSEGKYQLRLISISKSAADMVNPYFDDVKIKTYDEAPVEYVAPVLSIDPEKGEVDNEENTIKVYGDASKSDFDAGRGTRVKVYTDDTFATETSTISNGSVVVLQDADNNIFYYDVVEGQMTIDALDYAYSSDDASWTTASKTDIKNGYYKYTATASNDTAESKDITPVIALYDATGKLVNIDFAKITLTSGQTASATAKINVTNANDGMYIKTFIWDSIGNAKPYETEPVKILIIGNSITQHGASAEKGWLGTWGMAASAQDKDYVHQLMSKIDAAGYDYQVEYKNISEFEKYFYDWSKFSVKSYDNLVKFDADIIIATFGANCKNPNNEGDPGFSTDNDFTAEDYEKIIAHFNADGNAKIIVGKTTLTNKNILDTTDAAAAKHADWKVVDMTAYTGNEYDATSYYMDYPDVFTPGKVIPGVLGHPGDKAMAAMANDLWNVLPELMDSVR